MLLGTALPKQRVPNTGARTKATAAPAPAPWLSSSLCDGLSILYKDPKPWTVSWPQSKDKCCTLQSVFSSHFTFFPLNKGVGEAQAGPQHPGLAMFVLEPGRKALVPPLLRERVQETRARAFQAFSNEGLK